MTLAEYDAVRSASDRFVIAAHGAHFNAEAERVIEETDRYWVMVEKIGQAAQIAEQSEQRDEAS